jgi:hypothetical protein
MTARLNQEERRTKIILTFFLNRWICLKVIYTGQKCHLISYVAYVQLNLGMVMIFGKG